MIRWYVALAMNVVVFFALIGIVLLSAGCGQAGVPEGEGCVGTVTKTYTEYKAEPSGSPLIPAGSTRYYIAIERADGTFCSKRLDKNEWLGVKEGDTWPA